MSKGAHASSADKRAASSGLALERLGLGQIAITWPHSAKKLQGRRLPAYQTQTSPDECETFSPSEEHRAAMHLERWPRAR